MDRRTKVRHRRVTFVVIRTTDGTIRIEYSSKKFGLRTINPHSALADELREVKPEAFAAPTATPATRKRR